MWCLHGIYVCVQYVSLLGVCKHYVFVAPACVCVQTADHVYVITCLHSIQYKSVSVHKAHRQWRQPCLHNILYKSASVHKAHRQ